MGSPCEIQIYCDEDVRARHIANLVIEEALRIETKYSRYREDSVLSHINRVAAKGGHTAIDEETLALLNYADTCYEQSGGLFDISSGILREAWDFKSNKIPSPATIKKLLSRIGWNKIKFSSKIIEFTISGMQLDFGGIGKEYAVDRAAAICRQQGIELGLIDMGGDIRILGPHADGRPWSVGIRHPRRAAGLMASIEVYSGAIASSGDYERCIVLNGKRFSHIMNPKTGRPVQGMATVTVVAEQCVVAGSACTITMLMEKKGKKWIKNLGLRHIWMDQNEKIGGNIAKN